MKKQKILIIILCAVALSAKAQSPGYYDGIYSTNPNIGYISFREKGGAMVAILNQTYSNYYVWIAAQGQLSKNTIQLTTIIGDYQIVTDVAFTPGTTPTFKAVQKSCVPLISGDSCLFPNGTRFTGARIW